MEPPSSSGGELKQIFDSFDLDKSGAIDLKQLGSVAAKLGKEIPPEQLASIVKKLDSNKDGKISYGEFQYWWNKGMEGKMMELVFLKAQAMKLTNLVKKKASALGISFEGHKGKEKPDKYSIKLSFGAEVKDSITVDAGVYVGGQRQAELRQKIKTLDSQTSESTYGIVMKLASKNAAKSKAALDHTLNSILKSEGFPIEMESIEKNSYFKSKIDVVGNDVIVKLHFEGEVTNAVSPMSTQAEGLINQIGKGFYSQFDFHFSLNSTVEQLLSEPLLNNILKGFNTSLLIQANNSALSKFRKFAQKSQIDLPAFVNLITLFRSAKFHLGLKSPEQLQSFFKKLGIDDLVGGLPTLQDLLEQLTPMVKQSLNNKNPFTDMIHKLSRYAFEHVENDVEIYLMVGPVAVGYLRLQGKGTSKLHSIIFNEK